MICTQCNEDRDGCHFLDVHILDPKICNKCHYNNKLKRVTPETTVEKICYICKNPVEGRRWKFCSKACALEGNKENLKTNWRKNITAPTSDWRRYKL